MFKPFDEADWDAWAGCEKFPDGSEPLVDYDITIDGLEAVAVLDANGFYLQVLTPDGDVVSEVFYGVNGEAEAIPVMRFLAGCTPNRAWSTGELVDMGIEPQRVN